jgi:4-hydroxythreonine-4-phosphate dehydrogenase
MIGLFSSKPQLPDKPVAVSMGEPAGIGPECLLKAWAARKQQGLQPFFIIGDPAALAAEAKRIDMHLPIREISKPSEALGSFAKALPVYPLPLHVPTTPGAPDPVNAPAVIESIRLGAEFAKNEAAALVTLPIHKSVLYHSGFNFPGHTEFLGEICGGVETVMMLEVQGLRVVLTTVHISLKEAVALITTPRIVSRALITANALKQSFGLENPRIAIAGLNPHAGEEGAMGLEEIEIIQPAIDQLKAKGVNASGPHSADTLFHAGMRVKYDCAHCHYHDQGLIPIKTLDFYGGVNITLGLPIIRTSPDHGTALNIAGQNKANALSTIVALSRASQLAKHA